MRFKTFFLKVLILVFIASIITSPSQAAEPVVRRHTLDNGLVVLVQEMPRSPVVSIYILIKTGSANEGPYLGTGISHFVEHMLFKGTKKRAVGAIPNEVKSIGGTINASTSYDYTMYTLDVPKASFAQGFDIVSDMVLNSVFDPAEVGRERDVIFGEMRMINDRPERKLGDLVGRAVYLQHPYRHPIIGYVPLFGQITQKQLVDYYQTHYIPNNMVVSVAGSVKDEDVIALATQTFKDIPQKPYPDRHVPQEQEQINPRRIEQEYPSKITRFSLTYRGVSLFNSDMYALDVLAMILGHGDSSRLYQDVLKNKQLVTGIGTFNYTPLDAGTFHIGAEFEQGDIEKILKAVHENIDDIKKNGVRPDELEKARHQVMSSLIFGRQVTSSVAYNNAVNEAMSGDYDFDRKYLEHIRKLAPKDIQRVAQKYLIDDASTLVVLKPVAEKKSSAGGEKETGDSEIIKEVLPNGLTVLVKEDHTLEIASIYITFRAGSREEPDGYNGLNQLTADLWSSAAGKWNSKDISRMVEERGASLSSSGGFSSLNLNLNFLSQDTAFALDLVEAFVKDPKFAPDDFKNQQNLNIATLIESEDSLIQVGMKELRKMMFSVHPFKLDIAGTVDGVKRVTRQQVAEHYKKFMTPDHMVVSLFGDIDSTAALKELKKRFGALSRRSVALSEFREDPPKERKEKTIPMPKEQAAVLVGFRAPDLYDADRDGMDVISAVMGGSLSGRLFVKIREELGGAYTLGASYSPSLDAGLITFYVLTNDAKADQVKDVVLKEIQALVDVPVGAQELAATKVNMKGEFAMSLQTMKSLSTVTALDVLYGFSHNEYKNFDARIDKVTAEDVQRIAKKYFNPAQASVVVVRPRKTDGK